jgi:ketosteroid isomerase-like protein
VLGDKRAIAKRGLDALARRSYEEARTLCSEDVELWTLYDVDGKPPKFRGRDGLRAWFARLDELWAFIDIRDVEVLDHDGGWVLMRVDVRLRGRGSRREFEPRISVAINVDDGQVTRFGLFVDEARAVEMIEAG